MYYSKTINNTECPQLQDITASIYNYNQENEQLISKINLTINLDFPAGLRLSK